jgi:hypothetical protein
MRRSEHIPTILRSHSISPQAPTYPSLDMLLQLHAVPIRTLQDTIDVQFYLRGKVHQVRDSFIQSRITVDKFNGGGSSPNRSRNAAHDSCNAWGGLEKVPGRSEGKGHPADSADCRASKHSPAQPVKQRECRWGLCSSVVQEAAGWA